MLYSTSERSQGVRPHQQAAAISIATPRTIWGAGSGLLLGEDSEDIVAITMLGT